MTTKGSDNPFPSILVVEATEPAAPAAGQQRLYIDSTSHLLKATNSSGVERTLEGGSLTDHTHAVTGSGATGGGATLNPTSLKLPTSMGTTEGQVEYDTAADILNVYDGQRERGVSVTGWTPVAYPLLFSPTAAYTTALALTANGGSIQIPMFVPGHMLLHDVSVYNTDTTLARTWNWGLYVEALNNGNGAENTLSRVAVGTAAESFTAAAASRRFINASTLPTYLPPGIYYMLIQNQHASNTFGLGSTAQGTSGIFGTTAQTKTTTNPNGATVDMVAATWTAQVNVYAVLMRGRVFGMTTVF